MIYLQVGEAERSWRRSDEWCGDSSDLCRGLRERFKAMEAWRLLYDGIVLVDRFPLRRTCVCAKSSFCATSSADLLRFSSDTLTETGFGCARALPQAFVECAVYRAWSSADGGTSVDGTRFANCVSYQNAMSQCFVASAAHDESDRGRGCSVGFLMTASTTVRLLVQRSAASWVVRSTGVL